MIDDPSTQAPNADLIKNELCSALYVHNSYYNLRAIDLTR
jgi:hypothetical protein